MDNIDMTLLGWAKVLSLGRLLVYKKFHNSPETKSYLSGDKLRERVVLFNLLCALGTRMESRSQEAHACFLVCFYST